LFTFAIEGSFRGDAAGVDVDFEQRLSGAPRKSKGPKVFYLTLRDISATFTLRSNVKVSKWFASDSERRCKGGRESALCNLFLGL
jgi:hypothetical protein